LAGRIGLVAGAIFLGLIFVGIVLAATPVAADKTVQTNQGVAKTITLTATDDAGALDFNVTSGPSHGGLDNTSGTMTCDSATPANCSFDVLYTPDAGQWTDSFTYTVTNVTDGTSPAATVSITVDAAPVAVDDPDNSCSSGTTGSPKRYIVVEDSPLTVNPNTDCGLLLNDTDADSGDTLTAAKLTDGAHGTVSVTATGGFTYSPNPNYFGLDSFTYTVSDGLLTDTGTVLLTVLAVDDPPNAVNDTGITIAENAPATAIDVLANDTYLPDAPETLTIVAATQGGHGTVAITGGGTGLTYQPDLSYVGTDQFTYTIQDSGGTLQDTATVSLTVGKDITPPVATAPSESIRVGVQMQATTMLAHFSWSGSDAGVGLQQFQLQRSINGGSYVSVSLAYPKATSLNTTLTFGTTYRFRVRAIDLNGNISAWKYGPSFRPLRYEETSGSIAYAGSWLRSPYFSSYSGHYTKYSSLINSSASFTVSGRDFAFVAPRSVTRGSAAIYVDGVKVASVSLKSSTTLYRQVMWSGHFFPYAIHTIKIVVIGNGRIDVDCFFALRT
jgi:VCBS repeat-containing protein